MSFKDNREYIKALQKHGELQVIDKEVHWNLEAGAILRRTYEQRLPAPLFQKITGYPGFRMFGGALSSLSRVALNFDMPPDTHLRDLMKEYSKRKARPIKPVVVKDAPCKENIRIGKDVNLFELPAPMVHEGDGGRFLCTWHINIVKDLETDWVNWGMYRAMIHTRNTMGGLLDINQHIGLIHWKYENNDKEMPFALVIGPDPLCAMAACSKIAYGTSEVDIAGGLKQEPVELVKCETNNLYVPAHAEIIIEGVVKPHEREWEGPFGEFTGYRASPRDKRPVYSVKAVTFRNDPILTMSCMGIPIDDCAAQMSVTGGAENLATLKREGIPVVDVCLYQEMAHFLIVVSTKTPYANIASRIATCLWGSDSGYTIPYVVVVNDDIDPHDIMQVMHALATKCHPYRGITRLEHAQGFSLQPFLSRPERLSKQGARAYFDCTWPLDWDPSIAIPPKASFNNIYSKEVQDHVLKNWKAYGFKEGIPDKKPKGGK